MSVTDLFIQKLYKNFAFREMKASTAKLTRAPVNAYFVNFQVYDAYLSCCSSKDVAPQVCHSYSSAVWKKWFQSIAKVRTTKGRMPPALEKTCL